MTNTVSTLSGLFKEVYAEKLSNLIPDGVKLIKMVPFIQSDKEIGNLYHQPVQLSHEHGVTYAGPNSSAFTLMAPIAAVLQDGQVAGSQMLLRSAMSYEAAARASNDKKAFVKATQLMVQNMMNSISKRVEIAVLYGQSGLGVSASSANVGVGSTRVTFATASWAPGIWAGSESAALVAYDAANARINASDVAGFTVSSVSLSGRTVLFTAANADIAALDIACAAGPVRFFFLSAVTGSAGTYSPQEFAGLDKIVTNTGLLFNINAANYALWQGNSYDALGAALSLSKILSAVSLAVERGLDEDVICLVANKTWSNIASDQAALRMYDSSYKSAKSEAGSESFSFHGQNGKIEIVESIYIKEGEAFILPVKKLKRIGAMDISFKMPGRQQQEDFFLELANGAGYELRVYTDQALFCESPAKMVKIINIVNS